MYQSRLVDLLEQVPYEYHGEITWVNDLGLGIMIYDQKSRMIVHEIPR